MKKIYSVLIVLALFGCSNDDDNDKKSANAGFLKSTSINGSLDESFDYRDGYLASANENSFFYGNYSYNNGNLYSMINDQQVYFYEYDNHDNLKKRKLHASSDYVELVYQADKVVYLSHFELEGNPETYQVELRLNEEGKIIKTDFLEDQTSSNVEYQILTYDTAGNITQITTKVFGGAEVVTTYQYDDKVNPYYNAFKKFYDETYLIEFAKPLNLINNYGLTPNNLTGINGETINEFTYRDDYPVTLVDQYGSTITFKYY
ncbi:MAG TPA: hypothetical protein VGB50_06490 [Flavobacterium sp.]|jgi:hypothetical protein